MDRRAITLVVIVILVFALIYLTAMQPPHLPPKPSPTTQPPIQTTSQPTSITTRTTSQTSTTTTSPVGPTTTSSPRVGVIKVALYTGRGVWREGVDALRLFFSHNNVSYAEVNGSDIREGVLGSYDVLIMPGGWAWEYYRALGGEGVRKLRDFVEGGGIYIGICAGAYLAAKTIVWEGKAYVYSLGLCNCTASGPKEGYPWPSYGILNLTIRDTKFFEGLPTSLRAFYYGGPEFLDLGNTTTVLATYDDDGEPAIVANKHGGGYVVALGVHLEIRDDTWPYLYRIIYGMWELLRNTHLDPPNSSIASLTIFIPLLVPSRFAPSSMRRRA